MTRKSLLLPVLMLAWVFASGVGAGYDRNKAVPVQSVSYGSVQSVREITQQELVEDQRQGWRTFGGALIGGLIGNQFGDGSGRDVATVLGALIGGGVAHRNAGPQVRQLRLVEMMIQPEQGSTVMVVQDYDPGMVFRAGDSVRVVYLANGQVRVDRAY